MCVCVCVCVCMGILRTHKGRIKINFVDNFWTLYLMLHFAHRTKLGVHALHAISMLFSVSIDNVVCSREDFLRLPSVMRSFIVCKGVPHTLYTYA